MTQHFLCLPGQPMAVQRFQSWTQATPGPDTISVQPYL